MDDFYFGVAITILVVVIAALILSTVFINLDIDSKTTNFCHNNGFDKSIVLSYGTNDDKLVSFNCSKVGGAESFGKNFIYNRFDDVFYSLNVVDG